MQDRVRVSGGIGKSSKLKCPNNYNPASFSTFIADLQEGRVYVDVTATTVAEGGVTVMGTALNKANMLTDETAEGFGFDATADPTINDVLERISNDYISGTLTAGQTTLTLLDERLTVDSFIDGIYCDKYGVAPKDVQLGNGSITMTFKVYSTNIGVKVRVF